MHIQRGDKLSIKKTLLSEEVFYSGTIHLDSPEFFVPTHTLHSLWVQKGKGNNVYWHLYCTSFKHHNYDQP